MRKNLSAALVAEIDGPTGGANLDQICTRPAAPPPTGIHSTWLTRQADLTLHVRLGRLERTFTGPEKEMAKLALIYGLRLLPEEDLAEVREAIVVLKNGKTARVAMHLIEGTKEEIESTFHESVQAFFELYPEI